MLLWLYFAGLTLFWGMSFVAIRVTLDLIPPFAAAGLRIGLGGLLIFLVARLRHRQLDVPMKTVVRFIGIGALNFGVAWACLFWGEQYVSPGLASIVNSTVPLFVAMFAWSILPHERPVIYDWGGAFLGIVGMILVFWPSLGNFQADPQTFFGLLAILGMALAYGLSNVFIRKWAGPVGAEWSFVLQAVGATAVLASLSLGFESTSWMNHISEHPRAVLGILYLTVFSTALAWLMFYKLIMAWGSIKSSAITYCMPFVSVAVDWAYYGHLPGLHHALGALCIFCALALLTYSKVAQKSGGVDGHTLKAA